MIDTILKNLLPISITAMLVISLLVFFSGENPIPRQAKKVVTTWALAKKNNDHETLLKIYDAKTIIQIERYRPNGQLVNTQEIPSSTIIRAIQQGRIQNNPNVTFIDTKYTWDTDNKNIIASSIKQNLKTGQKKPHIMILAPNRKQQWFIIKEFDVEYNLE